MLKKIPLIPTKKQSLVVSMRLYILGALFVGLTLSSAPGFALTTNPATNQSMAYRSAIVAIINQLQRVKPTITQAENAAPSNAPITLHFERWKDRYGHFHNGVRNDIDAIQAALIQALNRTPVEPRSIQPLKADFVGGLK